MCHNAFESNIFLELITVISCVFILTGVDTRESGLKYKWKWICIIVYTVSAM